MRVCTSQCQGAPRTYPFVASGARYLMQRHNDLLSINLLCFDLEQHTHENF